MLRPARPDRRLSLSARQRRRRGCRASWDRSVRLPGCSVLAESGEVRRDQQAGRPRPIVLPLWGAARSPSRTLWSVRSARLVQKPRKPASGQAGSAGGRV